MAEETTPRSEANDGITVHVSGAGLKAGLASDYTKQVTSTDDVEGHEFDEEDLAERAFHVNGACCT